MNKLIVFEGIDGSGKTTMAKSVLANYPSQYFRPSKQLFSDKNLEMACKYDWSFLLDFLQQIKMKDMIIADRSPISQYVYSWVYREDNVNKIYPKYTDYEKIFNDYMKIFNNNFDFILVYCRRATFNANDALNPHITDKSFEGLTNLFEYFLENFCNETNYLTLDFEDGIEANKKKLFQRINSQFGEE
jgi:thymidylate kinase